MKNKKKISSYKKYFQNTVSIFILTALFFNFYLFDLDLKALQTSISNISLEKRAYKRPLKIRKMNYAERRIALNAPIYEEYDDNEAKDFSFCVMPETNVQQNGETSDKQTEKPKINYTGNYVKTSFYPKKINPGQLFQTKIYVKNTGNARWISDKSGCPVVTPIRLGTKRAQDRPSRFWSSHHSFNSGWVLGGDKNRLEMVQDFIDPNETAIFMFWSVAPQKDGIFREYFQPVVEGIQWFESTDFSIDIPVGVTNEQDLNEIKVLGKTLNTADIQGEKNVEVDLSDQKVFLKVGEIVINEFPISSGAPKTPTPQGQFYILFKQDLRIGQLPPFYRMPNFQALNRPKAIWTGVGFHSLPYLANDGGTFWTEALNHIGIPVSHGCIRLLPEDSDLFYAWTELNTKVVIHK